MMYLIESNWNNYLNSFESSYTEIEKIKINTFYLKFKKFTHKKYQTPLDFN